MTLRDLNRTLSQGLLSARLTRLLVVLLTLGTGQLALAQGPTQLGTAQSFAVLGGSTVTNTGPTIITGDLGVAPGTAITGFPPGTVVGGAIHDDDALALQAQNANTTAYNTLASKACNTVFGVPTDIGGLTLVPGVYCFSSSAQLTGALTLDAGGDSNAAWVFKVASTLITASNASVLLINGASSCNVAWQVGSSATIGTGTNFVGDILALTSITLTTNATLSGRALAQNGAVTMDSNTVTISACALPSVPPTITKSFSPATIDAGGVSTLTLDLNNSNTTSASMTDALTDTLPAGLVISGNASTTCGGSLLADAGGSTITLSGGAIPANGSCTVTVDVTAADAGSYINSIPAGGLKTTGGDNSAPAVSTLTAVPVAGVAPTLSKAFTPATMNAGGTSSLTITLTNASNTAATLTAPFVDNFPSGLLLSGDATSTCGGTVTGSAGGNKITLTDGTIPANGSCTITAPVTAANAGSYFNSLPAGSLQTSNGNNSAPVVSTLTVSPTPAVPPTLAKLFTPASITAGGTSSLTITLSNANNTAAAISTPFVDTFPGGLVLSGTATTTCGGTVSGSAGGSSVTLTGGAIPANGSCTITAAVTAANAGSYLNSLAVGSLHTSNGNNSTSAGSTLTVVNVKIVGPTLSKSFNPAALNSGSVSTLTITLNNASSTIAKLLAPLVDQLPGGMVVAAGTSSNTCGGTVVATVGGSTVTLTGGSIPANGSCSVTTHVVESTCICMGGTNTIPAGALKTSNGNNAAAASATLSVITVKNAPTVNKWFLPYTIKEGGISTLTIRLSNPNSTSAKLTSAFTDTFPTGLLVSGNASTTCGGTVTAVAGSSKVTLTGGTIPANGSCTITVNVTQNHFLGRQTNTIPIGALQTSNGKNTAPFSANLAFSGTGTSAPKLNKWFLPYTIKPGGISRLTISLSNPNSTVAKLTAPFTDTFPSGLVISGSASTTCGGVLTAIPGSSKFTLTGGSIPANGSCTMSVNVTGNNFLGTRTNTLPVGVLQTSIGTNSVGVSANLAFTATGYSAPLLSKSFSPSAITNGTSSTLTITLKNPNSTVAKLTAPLVDLFPAGMMVVGNASSTCGGTLTATKGSSSLTLTGGSIPANGSCKITASITTKYCYGKVINTLPVSALKTSDGNNTAAASATLTVQ